MCRYSVIRLRCDSPDFTLRKKHARGDHLGLMIVKHQGLFAHRFALCLNNLIFQLTYSQIVQLFSFFLFSLLVAFFVRYESPSFKRFCCSERKIGQPCKSKKKCFYKVVRKIKRNSFCREKMCVYKNNERSTQ